MCWQGHKDRSVSVDGRLSMRLTKSWREHVHCSLSATSAAMAATHVAGRAQTPNSGAHAACSTTRACARTRLEVRAALSPLVQLQHSSRLQQEVAWQLANARRRARHAPACASRAARRRAASASAASLSAASCARRASASFAASASTCTHAALWPRCPQLGSPAPHAAWHAQKST